MNVKRPVRAAAISLLLAACMHAGASGSGAQDYLAGVSGVAAGGAHTCALVSGGNALCWGSNTKGQLGDGSTIDRAVPTLVPDLTASTIAAGRQHTCAVRGDGSVVCWGANDRGQLGDGTRIARTRPTQVSGLPNPAAQLEGRIVAIAAGSTHSCALTQGGAVFCWGDNDLGQLGTSWQGPPAGGPMAVEGLKRGVVAISAGSFQTCALLQDGIVMCWGLLVGVTTCPYCDEGDGIVSPSALEILGLRDGAISIAAGDSHACAVLKDQSLRCWGYNEAGLGDGERKFAPVPGVRVALEQGAIRVSSGPSHTCSLLVDGSSNCWGLNNFGQIGDGSAGGARPSPSRVLGIPNVSAIAAGGQHTCAIESRGGVLCWGRNVDGELGNGSTLGDATSPGGRSVPGYVFAGGGQFEMRVQVVQGGKAYLAGVESRLGARREMLTSLVVIRRLVAEGGIVGGLDATWGEAGIARVPIWGASDAALDLAVQSDGKVVVLGSAPDPGENEQDEFARLGYLYEPHFHLALIRLNPDGSRDRSFNGDGRLTFRVGEEADSSEYTINSSATGLLIRPDGRIAIKDVAVVAPDGTIELVTASYLPGNPMPVKEIRAALEFTNDRNQYFLASDPDEAQALDRGIAGGWYRAGYAFRVLARSTPSATRMPVCRLYGGLLGHFFSADPAECARVAQSNPAWVIESSDAFRVEVADEAGACASGRVPVYRLLSPQAEGVRRYTSSARLAAALAAGGWIAEGRGPNHVAWCVP